MSISVTGLKKSYASQTVLRGVSFEVRRGTIMALLGPNGAGKTTTVKILATLLRGDGGTATIEGHSVANHPERVRSVIGLTGQYAAVDEYLTGTENLHMIGRLYRMPWPEVRSKSSALLQQFELDDSKTLKRSVKTYSGGMRRKLDLAMSLIAEPQVIFLDEPTTGLDPRSRLTMWHLIKDLAKSGKTILLTTQYMEEADFLADNIVVIDNGTVIAEGTSDELKQRIGSERIELTFPEGVSLKKAAGLLPSSDIKVDTENRTISFASKNGVRDLGQSLQHMDNAKIKVQNAGLRRPSLDDVFLTLTGHTAETPVEPKNKRSAS